MTPASYLELLTTFIKLLGEKRRDIGVSKQRLEAGLSKLLTTATQVEVMQVRLLLLSEALLQIQLQLSSSLGEHLIHLCCSLSLAYTVCIFVSAQHHVFAGRSYNLQRQITLACFRITFAHCCWQGELRQLQPVLEKTAVEVEAMMVRITADKKEAAVTQKAVAQQEQDANEQAAKV